MEREKIWDDVMPKREGNGVYADKLMENFPYLPVEEEDGLETPFFEKILYREFLRCIDGFHSPQTALSVGSLGEFHARHKLILMSHDQTSYRELGQLVARTSRESLLEDSKKYLLGFMKALKRQLQDGITLTYYSTFKGI